MGSGILIKRVWRENFEEEMSIIADIITKHPIASLTTRVLLCCNKVPLTNAWGDQEFNYAMLQQMVLIYSNIVQVGLALSDSNGYLPLCNGTGRPCVWEFNLMPVDPIGHSGPSGDAAGAEQQFLQECCAGVDIQKMRSEGIHPAWFAVRLWLFNMFMRSDICWVVFKGGMDFGSLMRWIRHNLLGLPSELEEFLSLVRLYFPVVYDVAALLGLDQEPGADGTVEGLARSVLVTRDDEPPHGAASDSLLVLRLFMGALQVGISNELLQSSWRVVYGLSPWLA